MSIICMYMPPHCKYECELPKVGHGVLAQASDSIQVTNLSLKFIMTHVLTTIELFYAKYMKKLGEEE